MTDKLRRRPWVEEATGLSRSSIYAAMKDGTFPKPVQIGKRAVAWSEADIAEWIASLGR
ncbi:AlpA family transcriptional regulator [Loktanella sp. IMCC34160]|uniref:helix-turn-helix transcriptional regulator n=1 Tax=Loktanella sp. IMCC34160 TaxID=2510646 RepID=UPI00101D9A42|nr:AlpA family transcriptional regulator [Loktanella sp. IMCC34160]RYG92283.1 AlpA family transcriptional regulator [Loktanella sp. IMCC34160]